MKCEKCKEREAVCKHHTVFDKVTNKSDKDSPKQDLCVICHAEEHGQNPNTSEIRTIVQSFNAIQRLRIMVSNAERSYTFLELMIPDWYKEIVDILNKQELEYSKQIEKLLEGKDHVLNETHYKFVQPFPIWSWLKEIKGISHLLSSQLIAYIDIKKFDRVSSLWHYCGMHVSDGGAPKRRKGSKIDWHPTLRMICFKISDSFIKQRTPKYREIYDKEKAKQLLLMENHMKVENHSGNVQNEKEESHIINENHRIFASPPKSLGHADMRARRKAVKAFLKDLWVEWRKLEGLIVTEPKKEPCKV